METRCSRDEKIRAMLFEDGNNSNDDGEVDIILSNPESDYDSSSDNENVGGILADASNLKSCDSKESRSIAPITSSQGITGAQNVVRENS